MNNKIQDGKVINYINEGTETITSGSVVAIGTVGIGIAVADIGAGSVGAIDREGIYELAADNTTAFAYGDALYWDATNKKLTKTATDNILAGFAAEVKGQTDAVGFVCIG